MYIFVNIFRFLRILLAWVTFGALLDPGRLQYDVITCPNFKIDITIRFSTLKLTQMYIFVNIFRFLRVLLACVTFRSPLNPGSLQYDVINCSNFKIDVTTKFHVQKLHQILILSAVWYFPGQLLAPRFLGKFGLRDRVTS